MKKKKNNNKIKNSADSNDFFEEANVTVNNNSQIKSAVKTTKETTDISTTGEYHAKNVIYKYKDGTTCTVVYNGKDTNFVIREMN